MSTRTISIDDLLLVTLQATLNVIIDTKVFGEAHTTELVQIKKALAESYDDYPNNSEELRTFISMAIVAGEPDPHYAVKWWWTCQNAEILRAESTHILAQALMNGVPPTNWSEIAECLKMERDAGDSGPWEGTLDGYRRYLNLRAIERRIAATKRDT